MKRVLVSLAATLMLLGTASSKENFVEQGNYNNNNNNSPFLP